METGFMDRIIGLVLALVVGGLLVGGLLIPSIEGMTATEKTFENKGYFYLEEYTGDDIVYSALWDHTKPTSFTVNGEEIPISYAGNTQTSIVLDGNFFVRYYPALQQVGLYYGSQAIVYATVADSTDLTLTYEDGVLTVTNGTATREITVDTFYSISKQGPYVMKLSDTPAYMKEDSLIYGSGRTPVGTDQVGTLIEGNINEVEITIWRGSATPGEPTINKTAVSGYKGLYALSGIQFEVEDTLEDNPTTEATITYNYFVVPATVTAELSQHMDATQIAMFGVISILGIVALVVVAANGIRNKY